MIVQAARRARRPLQIGFGTLALLGVSSVFGVWITRTVRENLATSQLVESVRSTSVVERRTAARLLGQVGASGIEAAIPALVVAVADSDQCVREAAAQALGASYRTAAAAGPDGVREAQAASQAMLRGLKDERPGVRASSALVFSVASAARSTRALERDGFLFDPMVTLEALSVALDDENDEVRSQAARAIGAIGRRFVAKPPPRLFTALKQDPSVAVRVSAARALGGFPTTDGAVLGALLSGLLDPNPNVVGACAASIDTARPTPELIPLLIAMLSRPERATRASARGQSCSRALVLTQLKRCRSWSFS